jgi:hypothetical protein
MSRNEQPPLGRLERAESNAENTITHGYTLSLPA